MDLQAEIADWPVGRAAVAVIGPDGVLDQFETGGGSELFEWKSVTKLLTALTVLDACADGTIELTEPAGPPGATVAHLLSHAAGLRTEAGEPVAPPGTRRLYSNYGFEVVAAHLAVQAGGPFADELAGRVLGPLGLHRTVVAGSPASAGVGPLDDLIDLAAEFLTPTVIGPEIIGQASTLVFPGLVGIVPGFGRQTPCDWGLGCEIRGHKSPHWTSPHNSPATFGHFGQSGSFLWVDPDAGLACVSLCDTAFGPWAAKVWPRLSTAVLTHYRS
ncbi:serine hydrolase [Nakamurella sp. PAMC28650]|uniref:serine hydrolase domain-containing protein n=1 Tax=Nakamurella sp. PAMC28650 TaxID=2762325 RepID=UPI00164E8190|nr:serine hydrolase domain-containing protein [Nakamurella sp. PAMC28650]QNK82274.1 beta-lactamase family protein [Nakamurella sp. PAMC28650]